MEIPQINIKQIKENLAKNYNIKDDSELEKTENTEEKELTDDEKFEAKRKKKIERLQRIKSFDDYSDEEKEELEKIKGQLKHIGQVVGSDFEMNVALGQPFDGSYFNSESITITLDPEHVLENPRDAFFVAGHEGAHRAITPNPGNLGFTENKLEKIYSQIGFSFLNNIIEDAVVNDWLQKKFVAFESLVKEFYDDQFVKDNVPFSNSEVEQISKRLGYAPLFAYYGAELLRYWHSKRLSEGLDPFVEKAVQDSLGIANVSIKQRPASDAAKAQVLATARKRFVINNDKLYPIMEELVEKDKENMAQRNAMEDYMKQKQEIDKKKQQQKEAEQNGDKQKADELQKEIDEMEKDLEKKGKLSKEALEELEKKIREQLEEMKKRQAEIKEAMDELKKQLEENKEDQKELEKQIANESDPGKRKELENQLEDLKKQAAEMEGELEDLMAQLAEEGEGEGDGSMPIPWDQLSDDLKKEIKEFFDGLPKSEKDKNKDKAKEQLKEMEDAMNEGLEGQLQQDRGENSHENQDKKKQEKKEEEERRKKIQEELERQERERQNKLSPYDRAAEDVHDVITELRNSFIKFFEPNRHPQWRKGFDSGQRPNMGYAMQAQIDPRYHNVMWERKTIPEKFSYNITLLLDMSASMDGDNLEESFKALVAIVESLSRFPTIDCEIIGYHEGYFQEVYKKGKERLSEKTREELGKIMTTELGGSTYTATAIEFTLKRMRQNRKQENILITLTDGGANDDLYSLMEAEKARGDVKFVGVGLGSGIDEVILKHFYPKVLYKPTVKLSERQIKNGENTFAEDLVELLKELIMVRPRRRR